MNEFLKKIRELFPMTEEEINEDTEYKYLDEWSSMTTLTLIAMVEDEYGITLTSEEIRNTDTVEELFNVIEIRL